MDPSTPPLCLAQWAVRNAPRSHSHPGTASQSWSSMLCSNHVHKPFFSNSSRLSPTRCPFSQISAMPSLATPSTRESGERASLSSGLNRLHLKHFIYAIFTKTCDHGDTLLALLLEASSSLKGPGVEASSTPGGTTSAGDLHPSLFTWSGWLCHNVNVTPF